MSHLPLLLILLCTSDLSMGSLDFYRRNSIPSQGYYDPNSSGGSMLTKVVGTFPAGQGEPINAIITANSDSAVLVDSEINGGLRNFFLSLDFSSECLGQHQGNDQQANLGDGNGYLNETAVIRYNYGDASLGSCTETIEGGNHFRYWVQNGKSANSSAIFMAFSYEKPISDGHDIVVNGYNLARDYMVGNITGSVIPTLNLTNGTTYSGSKSYGGYTYNVNVLYLSGLLPNTSIGINHNETVQIPGVENACDGLVAVMDVSITGRPTESSSDGAWSLTPRIWSLVLVALSLLLSLAPY